MLAKPGSITPHTDFEAQVYILSKDEGGRHTPFFNGYRPQFYFRTTDVTGTAHLPEGVEMVMPGDNVEMTVELIAPIAMEEGLRFAIREGGRTVGAGRVTKIIEVARATTVGDGRVERRDEWQDPKIRIKLRAYDHRMLDVAARDIVEHVTRTGREGRRARCRCRPSARSTRSSASPHKYKDTREHFQMLTHKRLIDIVDATSKTVQELQRLNLSAGVDIEIKL